MNTANLDADCQARQDAERSCPLCGRPFDASGYDNPATAVCCASPTMAAFYRGKPLTDAQIAWVYDNHKWATAEQREIAMWLADRLKPGEESVSATWESPHHTYWFTPTNRLEVEDEERRHVYVAVEFSGPYSRTASPVVEVTVGEQYTGLHYNVVTDIIERLVR